MPINQRNPSSSPRQQPVTQNNDIVLPKKLKKEIYNSMKKFFPEGEKIRKVKKKKLFAHLKQDFSEADILVVFNDLVKLRRLVKCNNHPESYRLREKEIGEKCYKHFDDDQNKIFTCIENSEWQSIQYTQIQRRANVPTVILTKCIKKLIKEKLIIRLKNSMQKKVYICTSFYDEKREETKHVDDQFLKTVRHEILRFCGEREQGATISDIFDDLKGKRNLLTKPGPEEKKASQNDIEDCVFALFCESDLEPVRSENPAEIEQWVGRKRSSSKMIKSDVHFRKFPETPASSYTQIPCCTCPVASICHEGGEVNPIDCPYLGQWLEYKP